MQNTLLKLGMKSVRLRVSLYRGIHKNFLLFKYRLCFVLIQICGFVKHIWPTNYCMPNYPTFYLTFMDVSKKAIADRFLSD